MVALEIFADWTLWTHLKQTVRTARVWGISSLPWPPQAPLRLLVIILPLDKSLTVLSHLPGMSFGHSFLIYTVRGLDWCCTPPLPPGPSVLSTHFKSVSFLYAFSCAYTYTHICICIGTHVWKRMCMCVHGFGCAHGVRNLISEWSEIALPPYSLKQVRFTREKVRFTILSQS